MPLRPIILVPDERLKTPCEIVTDFGDALREVVRDLEDTLADNIGCVGIASCQIGVMQCVTIVDTRIHRKHGVVSQGRFVLVNPKIVSQSGENVGREGCLSLPDFTANVARATEVTVKYQDVSGEHRVLVARDFEAVAMQHEIDHLDGILFLDRVSNLTTDVFPRKVRK